MNLMKKLSSHMILIIGGIIMSFFLCDIVSNLFVIEKIQFLFITAITLIILLHSFWWGYSKVISSLLKKDFNLFLRRDAITYLPFIALVLYPLKYLTANLGSKFVQFSHVPYAVILIFVMGMFVLLKVFFLEIIPKKEKSLKNVVIICIIIFFLFFSTLAILKHKSFYSTGLDLGIYDQTVYGYSKGKMYDSIMGFHVLGDHIELILFLIAPLYLIFKTPITLIIIQSILISIGAFVLYILSKKILKSEIAAFIMCLVYLVHPAIQYVILFDFHPTVLPLPFIFLAIYSLIQKNYKTLMLSLFFIAICKEYFPLILIPFGIFLFFIDIKKDKELTKFKKISSDSLFSKERVYGFVILLIGISWFLINLEVLIPLFHKGEYFYFTANSYFGTTLGEIAKTVLLNPINLFTYIFTLNKLAFLILFSSSIFFMLFALLAPEYIFLGITEIAILLLYEKNSLSEIVYHHQIPFLAIILAATVIGIKRLSKFFKSRKTSKSMVIACSLGILTTSILANVFFGPFTILYDINDFNPNKPYVHTGNKILSMIPENASVTAPNWVMPHLTRREKIYRLRRFARDEAGVPNADYVVIDLSTALTDPKRSARSYESNELTILFNKREYGITAVDDTWLLLKKGESYEQNICKIKPFLDKSKYPYLNINVKEKELIEKC